MANISKIISGPDLAKALQTNQANYLKGVHNGLKLAGLWLQRQAQQLVPVDFGNLKASAFTRDAGSDTAPMITVGFTAAYAPFVHENVAMKLKGLKRPKPHLGVYWGPHGQAKFLEAPARAGLQQMTQIVQQAAKQ